MLFWCLSFVGNLGCVDRALRILNVYPSSNLMQVFFLSLQLMPRLRQLFGVHVSITPLFMEKWLQKIVLALLLLDIEHLLVVRHCWIPRSQGGHLNLNHNDDRDDRQHEDQLESVTYPKQIRNRRLELSIGGFLRINCMHWPKKNLSSVQALSSVLLSRPQSQVRVPNILSPWTADRRYCQSQRIMKNWRFVLPLVCLAESGRKSITPVFSHKFHFGENLESAKHSTGCLPWIHPDLLVCRVQYHATGLIKYFSYLLWMVNDP